ncbi:hypothetical protein M378DRAFT_528230 [Amanita muscaria Koide BX008]|uniref:Protein kinase domain-containing protein n=1 Tax=Amanita muscaria (strain Koide BX008) TaxID=946122 RepID=A0A0C2TEY9_AMAMK|nr:hypothetical protein M378DRAFT_528230 [Amanita muscaria Koide BX008]
MISQQQECFEAFIWGNLSHGNMRPLLGLGPFQSYVRRVSPLQENSTLRRWRESSNPSASKMQQIVFQVANAIQYVHSLGIAIYPYFQEEGVYYLDSDNHAILESRNFRPSWLSDSQLEYDGDDSNWTLEDNICSFGLLFYKANFESCFRLCLLTISISGSLRLS